jgi:dolichol-phosphate mannosyltransferase
MDLTLVIPCYNEEDSIPRLRETLFPVVEELRRTRSVELLFIDDGSRDATYAGLCMIAEGRSDMRIVRHVRNRGLGAAQRTGFLHARGEIIVTTDSDGTYRFSEIPRMLDRLQPGVDIVTASPYCKQGHVENVPGYRLILSRGSSLIYQLLVNRHISTYTALFRAYRKAVVRRVPFHSNDFLAGTELLVTAMLMGYKVVEHPSTLHSRLQGVSKARIMRIIRSHLRFQWDVLKYRLRLLPLPRPIEGESMP